MTGVQAAVLGGSALVLLILALRLTLKDHLPRRLFPAITRPLVFLSSRLQIPGFRLSFGDHSPFFCK